VGWADALLPFAFALHCSMSVRKGMGMGGMPAASRMPCENRTIIRCTALAGGGGMCTPFVLHCSMSVRKGMGIGGTPAASKMPCAITGK